MHALPHHCISCLHRTDLQVKTQRQGWNERQPFEKPFPSAIPFSVCRTSGHLLTLTSVYPSETLPLKAQIVCGCLRCSFQAKNIVKSRRNISDIHKIRTSIQQKLPLFSELLCWRNSKCLTTSLSKQKASFCDKFTSNQSSIEDDRIIECKLGVDVSLQYHCIVSYIFLHFRRTSHENEHKQNSLYVSLHHTETCHSS